MPPVFWTGKLSLPMKFMVNFNNLFAWVTGNARDTAAMKRRMKLGYEGAFSDDVTHYDELGLKHYTRIATELLKEVDVRGKEVLDVGCGTGILSLLALQQGAARVVAGDLSEYMLHQCLTKATHQGYPPDRLVTRQVDAESLPYEGRSFDAVVSGMLLGLVPDQQKVIDEMTRVLRPGGMIAFSTHGPDCWWETSDASFRAVPKHYVLGYRIEYWPRNEAHIRRMLEQAKLANIRIRKLFWQDDFETGGKAYDFFAAVSASWWKAKFPLNKIQEISKRVRDYFEHNGMTRITHDIILAYAHKP